MPFLGVNTTLPEFSFSLVYNWKENGNLIEYVSFNPNKPRLPLVCKYPYSQQPETFIDFVPEWVVIGCGKGAGIPSQSGNFTWSFKRGKSNF